MIDGEALKERFRRGSGMLGLSSVLAVIDAQMEAAPSPALTREALAAAILKARSTTAEWKGNARATEPTQWDRILAKRILSVLEDGS